MLVIRLIMLSVLVIVGIAGCEKLKDNPKVNETLTSAKNGVFDVRDAIKAWADQVELEQKYKQAKTEVKNYLGTQGLAVGEMDIHVKIISFVNGMQKKHGELIASCATHKIYTDKLNTADEIICAAAFKQAGIQFENNAKQTSVD